MFDATIFIIRNGDFGSNFESKLIVALLALIVSLILWKKYRNRDYLVVYLVGTLLWAMVEFSIQFVGIREFNEVTLFGVTLPLVLVALLRGASEGGVVALAGLLIGDLILNKATRTKGLVTLFVATALLVLVTFSERLPAQIIGGVVASRRDIFALPSVAVTLVVTLASIYWLSKVKRPVRDRAVILFIVMIAMSGIWTLAQVLSNMRWVEVLSNGAYTSAPLLIFAGTLAYDVIFEIGFMYIPFFAIPYGLHLLNTKTTKK